MSEKIRVYAVVKVVTFNPSVPEAKIGDEGVVLIVFGEPSKPEAFEVESVNSDGTNKWLGTFLPYQLELIRND